MTRVYRYPAALLISLDGVNEVIVLIPLRPAKLKYMLPDQVYLVRYQESHNLQGGTGNEGRGKRI